jgi:uncharacterized protein (TIGR03437 family)
VQLNVTVSPNAQAGPVDLTVVCGLQEITLHGVLQVLPANPNQLTIRTPILNQATMVEGTPAGGTAIIPTVGVPQNVAGWTLQVDFIPTTFQMGGGGLISVQIPANIPAGAATVQLIPPGNSATIPPVVMQINAPPPAIVAAANSSGAPITTSNPAQLGNPMVLSVTGLTQSTNGTGLSQTQITVGGVAITTPLTILPGPQPDSYQIQFVLNPSAPYGPQDPVTVGIGTRISAPDLLDILPAQ